VAHEIIGDVNSPAVIIFVGPGPEQLRGLSDVLDGLSIYEPETTRVLAVCDRPDATIDGLSIPSGIKLETIFHPRSGRGNPLFGASCVGTLAALAHVIDWRPAFAIKIDTDALIIGRCFDRLATLFAGNSSIGVVGTRRSGKLTADTVRVVRRLRPRIAPWRNPPPGQPRVNQLIWGPERRVARWLGHARRAGWVDGSHCQGGAYAVSPAMLDALAASGVLNRPFDWLRMPLPEDQMMAALAAVCGYELVDLSGTGEPFAVEYRRLPKSAAEMIAAGHCLIHSVRGDPDGSSEADLRAFFASARAKDRARLVADSQSC
jgi:hypothetical protein